MIIEKIVFNVIAFILFGIVFLKIIKKSDISYIIVLGLQFLGILINFIELVSGKMWNAFAKIPIYIISIIFPIIICLIERNGNRFPVIFHLLCSEVLLLANKDEEAKKKLLKLIEKYPNSYKAHKMLAYIYEKQGKKEIAADEYARAIDLNENDKESYLKLANLSKEIGKKDIAIDVLYSLLRRNPEEYEATMLLGDMLQDSERYKEAILIYKNAIKYNPTEYDLYYQLGIASTMVNDFQQAKEYYEKAANLNSMLYNAKYNIGQIALIMGDLEEAKQYFIECAQNGETEVGGYYYLSLLSILKGDVDNAVKYMNLAIELDKKVYEKIYEEEIFINIRSKVKKPKNIEYREENISKREKKAKEHLENTYSLIGQLNHTDLEVMKNIKENKNRNKKIKKKSQKNEKEK